MCVAFAMQEENTVISVFFVVSERELTTSEIERLYSILPDRVDYLESTFPGNVLVHLS